MNFILIDGSYYVFYRYFALCLWWKKARNEDDPEDPVESPRFIQKFSDIFCNKLLALEKKLKIQNPIRLVAKDCPRKDIWRTAIYPTYKGTRKNTHNIKPFMKLAYTDLFTPPFVQATLLHPNLEADDCIAITAKHILEKYPDSHVWIIASDTDYLQLAQERVSILDLKGKFITENKKSTGDHRKDLLCKIIGGDSSDNIPGIFNRCGQVTTLKYANNIPLLEKTLMENPDAQKKYKQNEMLIDFNQIPLQHINSFKKHCLRITLDSSEVSEL